eukprot:5193243-Prymnesium_polylepis.2
MHAFAAAAFLAAIMCPSHLFDFSFQHVHTSSKLNVCTCFWAAVSRSLCMSVPWYREVLSSCCRCVAAQVRSAPVDNTIGNCSAKPAEAPSKVAAGVDNETAPTAQPDTEPAYVWKLPPWDKDLMAAGLKAMEQTLASAQSDPLLPPKPKPPAPPQELTKQLFDWKFDIFTIPYEDLPTYAYHA